MNLLFIITALVTLIVGTCSSSYETQLKSSSTFGGGIIVVEDPTTTPNGLYVSTSETYYSIQSPLLLKVGWASVSVNENNISVLLEKGIFFFTTFSALSKKKRDLIFDIRSRFLNTVTGLSLSTNFFQKGQSGLTSNSYDPYSIGELVSKRHAVYPNYGQSNAPSQQSCVLSNYYNLRHSPLNGALNGDVYLLDLHGNFLDVYSSSVSIYRRPGQSILYRDHRYFVYHRSNMPLSIIRVVLIGHYIIFVYNDLNVLAKASWQLNPSELELTITARNEIKKLNEVQNSAARINAAAEAEEKLLEEIEGKPIEIEGKPSEIEGKPSEIEGKPSEKEGKPIEKEGFFEKKLDVIHHKVDEFFEPIAQKIDKKIAEKKDFLERVHEKAAEILEEKKALVDNVVGLKEEEIENLKEESKVEAD